MLQLSLLRVPVLGGAQIIAFCGLIETTGFFQAASTTDGRGPREGQFAMKDSTEAAEPGNYGVGFPTFLGKVEDPEARKSKLAAELANGRLAMMVPWIQFRGKSEVRSDELSTGATGAQRSCRWR